MRADEDVKAMPADIDELADALSAARERVPGTGIDKPRVDIAEKSY
jgi:hypothetical protein